jgi:diguanylate cyclase (GGDEF)-like protein
MRCHGTRWASPNADGEATLSGTRTGTRGRLGTQLLALVRRPQGIVESTRWLFALMALASVLLSVGAPLSSSDTRMRLLAVVSGGVLFASWTTGYLRRSAPFALDALDSAAALTLAVSCPQPLAAAGFMIPAMWFRSFYGSARRAVVRCCMYSAVLAGSLPLSEHLPGHPAAPETGPLFGIVPTMFLTVIVGRHLAGILGKSERSTRRELVHLSVGSQLLGVTGSQEILKIAWLAIAEVCAATPGLRVLKVVRDGSVLRVDNASGTFARLPRTIPDAVLTRPGTMDAGVVTIRSSLELDAAAGTECAWSCVGLPYVPSQQTGEAWLFIGAPHKVPEDALITLSDLVNQVTMALRSSHVHEELTVQATVDNLTGLANRATFNLALAAALDDGSSQLTTVLFVDLDDFKDVNDLFGHGAGDDLLREVAVRLQRATRPEDLCARVGGDEFAVLLRGTNVIAGAEVAQRIVTAVAAPAHLGGRTAHVGASVGVATATLETDLEQLIRSADVAMYAAKANGKARIQVFEPGLLRGESSAGVFEKQLAAAARNGELVVHYQPIISLEDGTCCSVEALVRWQHPTRGLIYPDSFIAIAEATGAIHDIGTYVLRRACADVVTWGQTYPGPRLGIQVNVSALQLDDEAFIDTVTRCLGDFQLAPQQLVLEVTESVVISSPMAINRLNALVALGVAVAIDDFGTGYSALTTLRTLPARIVKIDRSFVAGSTLNPSDRAVIQAVVTMSKQMGLKTVAEGVERLEQEMFLRSIGADAVQGYLYLRPTTAEAFATWLAKHPGTAIPAAAGGNVVPFKPRNIA